MSFFGLLLGKRSRQRGVAAIEYALLAALIALTVTAGIELIGGDVRALYVSVSNKVTSATK